MVVRKSHRVSNGDEEEASSVRVRRSPVEQAVEHFLSLRAQLVELSSSEYIEGRASSEDRGEIIVRVERDAREGTGTRLQLHALRR